MMFAIHPRRGTFVAAVLLCGLLLSATRPACAASVTALDFVASAGSDNAFLAASSNLAASNAGNTRIIVFARRETEKRRSIGAELAAWAAAAKRADREADLGPSLDRLGQIFGPLDRAIGVTVAPAAQTEAATIAQLSTTRGAPFDDVFVASQRSVLAHLVATYVDFIQNGDDETLRALAVHDLPRARNLLAEARRLR